jgi:hypothetical protein
LETRPKQLQTQAFYERWVRYKECNQDLGYPGANPGLSTSML